MKWELFSEIVKLGEDGKYYIEADYKVNGIQLTKKFTTDNYSQVAQILREYRQECKDLSKEVKDGLPF